MGSQFFTAVGAFVGTLLGIWIAETSGTGKDSVIKEGEGMFGTTVGAGELVIPMTAGGVFWHFGTSHQGRLTGDHAQGSSISPVSVSFPSCSPNRGVAHKLSKR